MCPVDCPLLFVFVFCAVSELAIWLLTKHMDKHEFNLV